MHRLMVWKGDGKPAAIGRESWRRDLYVLNGSVDQDNLPRFLSPSCLSPLNLRSRCSSSHPFLSRPCRSCFPIFTNVHILLHPVPSLHPSPVRSLTSLFPPPIQKPIEAPIRTVASLVNNLIYENKDGLSAGIIVAGWDEEEGGSVYQVVLGGGIFSEWKEMTDGRME